MVDLRKRLSCCHNEKGSSEDISGSSVVVVVNSGGHDGNSSSCSSGFGDAPGDELDDGMLDVCMAATDQASCFPQPFTIIKQI